MESPRRPLELEKKQVLQDIEAVIKAGLPEKLKLETIKMLIDKVM